MSVHVIRHRATLVAIILGCRCLLPIPAVAFAPARQKLQNQHLHATRTLDDTPTPLAVPVNYRLTERQANDFSLEPGGATPHHSSALNAGKPVPLETASSLTDGTRSPDAVNAAAGAALAGAAAVAGAAVGSAAAAAGAAAAADGARSHPSVNDSDWETLEEALRVLSLEAENSEHHISSQEDHVAAQSSTDPSSQQAGSSPSSIRQSSNTSVTSSDGARVPSSSDSPMQAFQGHHSADSVTASRPSSLTGAVVPTDDRASYLSSSKRERHTALSRTNTLEPSALEQKMKKGEVIEPLTTSPTLSRSDSKTPDEELGPDTSNFLSSDVGEATPFRKPDGTAWLCRISEPYKGCNTRNYFPGMNDRTYDGETSAGKFYPGATCPEGFCCSRTACSSFGCGNICTDSSVLCLLSYEAKSNGRGCSCAEQPAPRCHPLASCHESLVSGGGVWCECPKGYKGNGLVCCENGTPGCDDAVRRPGVQTSAQNTGNCVSVSWATLCLLFATYCLHGVYSSLPY